MLSLGTCHGAFYLLFNSTLPGAGDAGWTNADSQELLAQLRLADWLCCGCGFFRHTLCVCNRTGSRSILPCPMLQPSKNCKSWVGNKQKPCFPEPTSAASQGRGHQCWASAQGSSLPDLDPPCSLPSCKHSLSMERPLAWLAEDRQCLGAKEQGLSSLLSPVYVWGGKKTIGYRQSNRTQKEQKPGTYSREIRDGDVSCWSPGMHHCFSL